jgi:hypothetical protein
MDVDGEMVVAWLRTWGVETVLGLFALAGLVLGGRGDLLSLLLGVALLAATADRVRLRLDNRSLAEAVDEASEVRVSAARRETPEDVDEQESVSSGRRAAPDADS